MTLWKDTFQDSDSYIQLIFDTYYNPDFVEYEVAGSDLQSALLGIPYEFGGAENRIKGLYLCGLATKPRHRGQGVMTRLIEKINKKAAAAGFAFTFLIPANELLHDYYARRGYVDAFHRCADNFTALHDFNLEFTTQLEMQKTGVADLKRRYYNSMAVEKITSDTPADIIEQIIEIITAEEATQEEMEILHSRRDIETIIRESQVSGDDVYYTVVQSNRVTAVAFARNVNRSVIDLQRIYSTDDSSRYRLLDHIKKVEPGCPIREYMSPLRSERRQLAEVYGMARILNMNEVLKFQAAGHGDLKYSILAKDAENKKILKFQVKGGDVKVSEIDPQGEEFDPSKTVISYRDLSSVVFRRPDTGSLITEAFGMPSLGGYISLMLD